VLLFPRIKDIIIDTFLSIKRKINPNQRTNVFELFGFDFLLDEDFRIWLIECNYNPFLGTPCDFMRTLVPNMIDDMLKIVLDPVIKPRTVPDPERENLFELLFRDASQKHGPAVNVRRPFTFDLLYHIPELIPFIGKKNPVKKLAAIPVQQLKRKIDPVPAKISSRALQDDEEDAIAEDNGVVSPRKELTSSATAVRSQSQGPNKIVFRKTRANSNY
jgi:hypothetical protein